MHLQTSLVQSSSSSALRPCCKLQNYGLVLVGAARSHMLMNQHLVSVFWEEKMVIQFSTDFSLSLPSECLNTSCYIFNNFS